MTLVLSVRLFGAFRDYSGGPVLTFQVEKGTRVGHVRDLIAKQMSGAGFRHASLVPVSALGNESEILDDGFVLTDDAELALLPPVCGGLR